MDVHAVLTLGEASHDVLSSQLPTARNTIGSGPVVA